LALGGVAALTYQVIDATHARGAGVARLSPSPISVALRTLAEHRLAEHRLAEHRLAERLPLTR
jgi:hypothetical protein